MTQMSLVTAAELDQLAYRGWPAPETQQISGWIARAAGGVTRRANSVLTSSAETAVPETAVPETAVAQASASVSNESHADAATNLDATVNLDAAIDTVEAFYRQRGLDPAFQVSDATRPAHLAEVLAERGYRREGETLTQVTSLETIREQLRAVMPPTETSGSADVVVTEQPDDTWLQMWWSVDGRGGARELESARAIMAASPAVYAAVHDETGVSAGARLALLDGWGALFSLVVRPNARRRGLATRTLAALVAEAEKRDITRLCLQVLATSHGALAFYESLGFETASHYRYWVLGR